MVLLMIHKVTFTNITAHGKLNTKIKIIEKNRYFKYVRMGISNIMPHMLILPIPILKEKKKLT